MLRIRTPKSPNIYKLDDGQRAIVLPRAQSEDADASRPIQLSMLWKRGPATSDEQTSGKWSLMSDNGSHGMREVG